jgi:hypothetical protein
VAAALLAPTPAPAQAAGDPPLLLFLRGTVPERGGAVEIRLTNRTDTDRQARVILFYKGWPDVQYGRDVWVPARATLSSFVVVGPAPDTDAPGTRRIQTLLYERTGGKERLLLTPGEPRLPSLPVHEQAHQPTTALLVDEPTAGPGGDRVPGVDTLTDEAILLAHTFRLTLGLPEDVRIFPTGPLPPTAETFDGIDHVILASGRLAQDPVGRKSLRRWLERGGHLWVLLDRVEPEAVAALLGDAVDFQVVDRIGLTGFAVEAQGPGQGGAESTVQQHERPVEFVRVLLPAEERPRHTVDGWPAWFSRPVGRGKVVFTTLGPRGWYRARTRTDTPSPYQDYPAIPVPIKPLGAVADELQPAREDEDPFREPVFRRVLTEDIGYAVVGRGTVAVVSAAFLLGVLALAVVLRRLGRAALLLWLGPATALGAAAAFVVLGESSRRAVPPTVAAVQVIDPVPGTQEMAAHGLLAVYRPDSGPADLGAAEGGTFELDTAGLEGQARRRILTDLDSWHWDNLALPAGVRFASFRCTTATTAPVAATARFGPEGLEGTLTAGSFRGLSDPLLSVPGGRNLAVRLQPDGTFRAGSSDVLPTEHFVAGALLNDRQQRRQEMYREFLKRAPAPGPESAGTLLAWAEPEEMPFTLAPGARTVGSALLVVPLRLERSAAGSPVTIPGPLLPVRRITEIGSVKVPQWSDHAVDMHLRFQLPAAALPLRVERARLALRINAPSRRITVSGRAGADLVELWHEESPLDPVRVEIADPRLLRLDEEGGLHLNLAVGATLGGEAGRRVSRGNEKWTIEYLELEVSGRAGEETR